MKLFVIICSILLLYIVVFFYIHWVNKRNKEGAVTTSNLLYGDARDSGYYPPDVPSWHNKTKNFEYWNSDKGIQNWISSSPQLIYTKSYAGNANGEDWFFPSDGLYYVTYNACYGLVHVAKDFGSNQRMSPCDLQLLDQRNQMHTLLESWQDLRNTQRNSSSTQALACRHPCQL